MGGRLRGAGSARKATLAESCIVHPFKEPRVQEGSRDRRECLWVPCPHGSQMQSRSHRVFQIPDTQNHRQVLESQRGARRQAMPGMPGKPGQPGKPRVLLSTRTHANPPTHFVPGIPNPSASRPAHHVTRKPSEMAVSRQL